MTATTLESQASLKSGLLNAYFFLGYATFYSNKKSLKDIRDMPRVNLFFLFIMNLLYRCYDFSLNSAFLALYVIGNFTRATLYNLIFIFGGFKSDKIFYLAGKNNQSAIKSFLFILFNTSAFIAEQINLLIGLFFPHFILKRLKEIDKYSIENNDLFESKYLYYVYTIGSFLQKHNLIMLSMVVTSLLAEPVDAIMQGMRMKKGVDSAYHAYGANPQTLTNEQLKRTPVLCLHGYAHNQSAFEQLLYDVNKQNPNQPMFTVNLPDIEAYTADYLVKEKLRQEIIQNKIAEIRELYKNEAIEPIIIGHSAGADAAAIRKNWFLSGDPSLENFLKNEDTHNKNDISSTAQIYILMGPNIHSNDAKDQYVKAEYDEILCLESEQKQIKGKPPLDKTKIKKSPIGHLGMLTDPSIINLCISTINNNQVRLQP